MRTKEFFQKYMYLLDKNARKKWFSLQILFLFSSLADVVGISLVGMFLGILASPDEAIKHMSYGKNLGVLASQKTLIFLAGSSIIVSFLLKTLFVCYAKKKLTEFSYNYALGLKLRLMRAYQHAPYIYHLRNNTANLLARIEQVDTYSSGVLMPSLDLIAQSMIAFSVISLLCYLHPFATLSLAVMFGIIIWVHDLLLTQRVTELGRVIAVSEGEILKNIQHGLHGLKEIKIFGREQYFLERVAKFAKAKSQSASSNDVYKQAPRAIIELLLVTFIIGLCFLSLLLNYSVANILSFVGVFAAAGLRLMPTITQLTSGISQLRFFGQRMALVYDEFQALEGVPPTDEFSTTNHKLLFHEVVLQNICFAYPSSKQFVLQGINLHIKKGEAVGFIGRSGSGKTTLINILLGFLEPQQGSILVDGEPIANKRAWLNNFAYIPQDIFLMDDTLKNNIALGVATDDIDMEQLELAIDMAQLQEVVQMLPNGCDTLLGEKGIRLSGGQRQRVALARTFYHDREIIVMDEATSSLDNETEHEIINTIRRLQGIKTLIVIAHRLTTVKHCNKLVRIDNNRVMKVGSYQEVIEERDVVE